MRIVAEDVHAAARVLSVLRNSWDTSSTRAIRCLQCANCHAKYCQRCLSCRDMLKHESIRKESCRMRRACLFPVQFQERKRNKHEKPTSSVATLPLKQSEAVAALSLKHSEAVASRIWQELSADPNSPTEWQCRYCDRSYQSRDALRKHCRQNHLRELREHGAPFWR